MYNYFYGWYLKCQSESQTLAVIPAVHKGGREVTCSIQIIADEEVWTASFPGDMYHRKGRRIRLGESQFSEKGLRLEVHTPKLDVRGKVEFGRLSPLKYDIMGPFALVPFMECRHSVWSMTHSVRGKVQINGQNYMFQNARGYWEGDRGRSFPRRYIWTQCCFSEGSLMLSVADIPMAGLHFTGIICAVLWKGKEYRMATYLGARAVQIQDGHVRIRQGNLELGAWLLEKSAHLLKAPARGAMVRTIHESASCRAGYCFQKKGRTLFAFQTDRASFEYEYPS